MSHSRRRRSRPDTTPLAVRRAARIPPPQPRWRTWLSYAPYVLGALVLVGAFAGFAIYTALSGEDAGLREVFTRYLGNDYATIYSQDINNDGVPDALAVRERTGLTLPPGFKQSDFRWIVDRLVIVTKRDKDYEPLLIIDDSAWRVEKGRVLLPQGIDGERVLAVALTFGDGQAGKTISVLPINADPTQQGRRRTVFWDSFSKGYRVQE